MKNKAFVGCRTFYYKLDAARVVLDHSNALRNGFTRSQNVHSEFSHLNCGHYYHGASSCAEALELMLEKHKQATGKKVRSDCNVLFEHVVWLSEHQYSKLEQKYGQERVREAFLARLKVYAESVRREFGFEPLGIELHLFDEGHYEPNGGQFVRNIHGHVQFFNYDFKKRVAPLRHLMNNGKDEKGRTNALNPNFVRLQDLVAAPFKYMGFERGESKLVTGREHQTKEQFVLDKLKAMQQANEALERERNEVAQQLLQQRAEHMQLAQQIIVQRQEVATWASEVQRLKDQFSQLQQLIKQKALSAIKQFSMRFSQSSPTHKPTR